MMKSKKDLGKWGEEKAAEFLKDKGFNIKEKNVRTSFGEIDLVVTKDNRFIFVEVKTRSTKSFGPPEVAITEFKREKLIQSAQAYMQEHPEFGNDWQIDVICIEYYHPGMIEVVHFENAISG